MQIRRCSGSGWFPQRDPKLNFICRRKLILTVNIDKNTEKDLQQVVERGSQLLNKARAELVDFTSHADVVNQPGHYVIYWEIKGEVEEGVLRECCREMDASFVDHGYVVSRKAHSIGPLELCIVERGTFKKILDYFVGNGAALSQFKTPRDASPNTNMSNWIECYSPSINAWRHVTRIPGLIENHTLKGFSMASIDDSIYIIGGRLSHKLPGHVQDEVDLEVQSSVLRYNVRDNKWHKCASLSTPRFDFACSVSDNKIYVAGGKCALTCPRGISSAEVYDPALDEWKALPNISTLRYKCVGVTWQGKIHVVGGFAERGNSNAEGPWHILERCSAEVYDSEHDRWNLMLGMWQLDVPPNQIVAMSGNLFSSGDCLNAWKGHIEAYDGNLICGMKLMDHI
ncbi:hypothetical protein GH714_043530 [Hevea brasiliensis]|uniref:GH3 C-terminal domain-containing protein n=1 Tax=Hevea brasiliensis TaxID=3981 RepID=A0A6A6K319_HEVBR|nr:hypothetical protein GH714_043530 [Hevea brasiliensis]